MSKKDEQSEAAANEEEQNLESEATPEEGGAEGPAAENSELEEALAKVDRYWDQLTRTHAEMDNLRKRAERDVANARKYGIEKFASELLGVRDSLAMGITSAQEEGSASKHVEGMELTLKMLVGIMEKFGIQEMNPEGEAFNPEYHEAMSARETDEAAPNTVLQVMQKGYLLHDRVLRPAMVVVARKAS